MLWNLLDIISNAARYLGIHCYNNDPYFSRPLGNLHYLRVWHDNSGKGHDASWYLKYIVIHDVQTHKKYYFLCNRWLAVEHDDGMVC